MGCMWGLMHLSSPSGIIQLRCCSCATALSADFGLEVAKLRIVAKISKGKDVMNSIVQPSRNRKSTISLIRFCSKFSRLEALPLTRSWSEFYSMKYESYELKHWNARLCHDSVTGITIVGKYAGTSDREVWRYHATKTHELTNSNTIT